MVVQLEINICQPQCNTKYHTYTILLLVTPYYLLLGYIGVEEKYNYIDIYNSQLRYGFRYLVYLVSPLLLERLTSISILLYQFEGQAYAIIHSYHNIS